jgi:hypothetical protein
MAHGSPGWMGGLAGLIALVAVGLTVIRRKIISRLNHG